MQNYFELNSAYSGIGYNDWYMPCTESSHIKVLIISIALTFLFTSCRLFYDVAAILLSRNDFRPHIEPPALAAIFRNAILTFFGVGIVHVATVFCNQNDVAQYTVAIICYTITAVTMGIALIFAICAVQCLAALAVEIDQDYGVQLTAVLNHLIGVLDVAFMGLQGVFRWLGRNFNDHFSWTFRAAAWTINYSIDIAIRLWDWLGRRIGWSKWVAAAIICLWCLTRTWTALQQAVDWVELML